MWTYLKFIIEILEGLIERNIHDRWPTDPYLANVSCIWHQIVFDELLVPNVTSRTIPAFANAHSQFEVSFAQFSVYLL